MMSPLDFPLSRILQILGFKVIRVIHDFSPHPGDKWQTKKSILRAAKFADRVICLSDFVDDKTREFVKWLLTTVEVREGTQIEIKDIIELGRKKGYSEKWIRALREDVFQESAWSKGSRFIQGLRQV